MVVGRRWKWGVWAWLFFAPTLWASQLSLQFPDAQMERGRTVRAVLATTQLQHPLSAVDLALLQPWFVVERRGEVEVDARHSIQRRVLWLTPRDEGEFELPPLSLAGMQGGAQAVRITPARDGKDGEVIAPRFPSLPARAWARQQVVYAVVVESAQRFLRLEVETGGLDGFEVMAIPQQVDVMEGEGRKRYRHTAGWLLFATGAGPHTVQLPALRYGREGVMSHRFYPPPQSIQIQPLPDYLPPNLAVGQVELQGAAAPWAITRSGGLQQRSFTLTTRGIPAQWWRPPAITVREPGAVWLYESEVERAEVIDADGLTVRYRYSLPLSIEQSGWQRLGPLQLQVFDPLTGRLQGRETVIDLPLALHLWQEVLLWLLLVVLLLLLARGSVRYLQGSYRYLNGYRSALRLLHGGRDDASLRMALMYVSAAEGWRRNLSLSQWRQHWLEASPQIDISHWMERYEAALYGGQVQSFHELRVQLLHLLQERLGGWRRVCEFRLR